MPSEVKSRTNTSNNSRVLWLLIGLALGVAITNIAIGGRHVKFLYQEQQEQHQNNNNNAYEPPPIRTREQRPNKPKRINNKLPQSRLQLDGDANNAKDNKKFDRRDLARARKKLLKQQTEKLEPRQLDVKVKDNAKVYDGDFITKILTGKKPFPKSNKNKNNNANANDNANRLKYKPGTLKLTHAQSFQHCYVNTTHYEEHIANRPTSLVSLSDIHKLIYRNVPKASSSTGRHAMIDFLEGDDHRMRHDDMEDKVHGKNYSMISFVREPLNRFYSSYDEAYFRMGPWMGNGPIVRDKPRVRKQYLDNKYKVDKYPYLYEGFTTIDDFRRKYCSDEILITGRFIDCNQDPSIDDGTLSSRFSKFVRDYTGLDPFDVHLFLQSSYLVFPTGEPFPITVMYNATDAERDWQEVAKMKGVDIPDGEMTHGRKITRRFDVSKVSEGTKRKICRMMALDYCCLNIELPEVCRGGNGDAEEGDDDDEAVYCAVEKRDDETMKYALEPLVIHPWRDP